jgi:hypothetical protein
VIRAALRLRKCSAEFDGDLSCCDEWFQAFLDACDVLQAIVDESSSPPAAALTAQSGLFAGEGE